MFNVKNKSNIYHVFDLEHNTYLRINLSFEDLIQFLTKFQCLNYHHSADKYGNEILSNLNITLNDKIKYYYFERKVEERLRKYVVIDSYKRIIDVRLYHKEILHFTKNEKTKRWNFYQHDIERIKKYVGNGYKGPTFRKDPIPLLTSKRRYCNHLRKLRTTAERREGFNKETQKYIRAKRMPMNIPTLYDDIYRHNDKSWKTQTKYRKQWMKNLK